MMARVLIGILVGAGVGSLMGHFGKCNSGSCPLTSTPTRGALYGGVLGLCFALATGGHSSIPAAGGSGGEGEANATLRIEGAEQFGDRVLTAAVPALVDFYSDNCPPCRRLAPTIARLAGRYEGRAVVGKANLDGGRNADLAKRYGIQQIPTVVFFQDGEEVERFVGLRGEQDYASVLERLLKDGWPSVDAAGDVTRMP